MKIAMFTDSYRPMVDGAVVAMETLIQGLEKRGHSIVILAPDTPSKVDSRWPVHYLPATEFRGYRGYRVAISPSDMLEFLRREKADVIHSHGLASMAILSLTAAKALKIPHVLTFHTMANEAVRYYRPFGMRDDLLQPLVWTYLRNMLRRPEIVIVPSRPIREELEGNGVVMKHCDVIPTGVDCSRFSPEKYEKAFLNKFGLGGKRVLLHVGRLSREKGLDVVIEAIAKLAPKMPDLRLLVAGTGPAEKYYKELAGKLGVSDRIVFAGFLPDDELPKAYASSEALVIASTFETQGIVVLEALASGTPVVGMRRRAIPEFIQEGKNGCLFDHGACAEAIQRCFQRSDSMKIGAVSSARDFTIDSSAAKVEKAYEKAAEILSGKAA